MRFLPYVIVTLVVIVPFWKIFEKAGFAQALSLLMLIPIVNLIALYFLAFSNWPGGQGSQTR
jgi:hypothetical protein